MIEVNINNNPMENEPVSVVEEVEQASEEQLTKKFTPFQWVVTILLAVLVLVLIGFLVAYALKGSKNADMVEEEVQQTTSGEHVIDPSVKPPSVMPEMNTSSENKTMDENDVIGGVKKPDLYVKSYDLDETPRIGDEFTAKIVIGNKGTVAAQGFSWEWWPTSSGRDCKGDIDGLAVGATKLVECEYTYDEADEYSTKFIIDTKDTVDEIDENNNVHTKEIDVAEKADLYISDYDFNHDPTQGEEFTVKIKIKNKGETDAEDFYWEWWPTVTGSKACREKIDLLKAGESETVECDYTYGGWANYTTKAVADADHDVDESDEGNNAYTENVIPIH